MVMSAPFLPICVHNPADFYLSSVQFDLYFAGQDDSKTLQSFSWYLIFSDVKWKCLSVAASNNRDHEITLVITISKYCQLFTSFTSIIRGNSPRSLHRNRSIIACLRHKKWVYSSRTSCLSWIAQWTQRQPRGCNTTLGIAMLINRKFDRSCKIDVT